MDGDLGGHPVNFGAGSRLGHRRPHSLKSVASAGRTLPIASWLSTTDRSMAGSKTGIAGAEVRDSFFPFFFRLGAMAAGGVGVRLDRGKKSAAFRKMRERQRVLPVKEA